jgi:hypothetical protein
MHSTHGGWARLGALSAVLGLLLSGAPAFASGSVTLNGATADQLASIDGVSADLAADIVALRAERGRISSVEALRILPGISESTLTALRQNTELELEAPLKPGASYGSVEEVLAEFAGEPEVQVVHEWAMSYSRTNPELVNRWMTASKTFALLPELRFEVKLKDGWDQDWQYYPADGVVDSIEDQDNVFDVLDDAGRDRDTTYTARVTWDLDKLVMSSERIRVINEAQDVVKLRDNVLSDVTKIYFERRQLQVQMLLDPKGDLRGRIKDQLRLLELTAQLDALTGGAFSAALPRQ